MPPPSPRPLAEEGREGPDRLCTIIGKTLTGKSHLREAGQRWARHFGAFCPGPEPQSRCRSANPRRRRDWL